MFTAFGHTTVVSELRLFEFTNEYLPSIPGNLWGAILLIVVLGHVIEMVWRKSKAGPSVAMLGFMAWVYATIAYILIGAYTAILLVAFFPLCYWAWYYFSSISYHKKLDTGDIKPVD